MNKSIAREIAMKMLYAFSLGGDFSDENTSDTENDNELSTKDAVFCRTLVEGVQQNQEELKEVISEFSQGWNVERIGKVEFCILSIAAYEILHLPEVPVGASINEAVELAKKYCDDKSPAYINGVLGSIGRKYRS